MCFNVKIYNKSLSFMALVVYINTSNRMKISWISSCNLTIIITNMIIIDNFLCKISNELTYKYLTNNADGIFLDIETTGLSKDHSMIYLIGLLFRNDPDSVNSEWTLRLMLAEKENEERELLDSLLSFLAGRNDPKMITFNGRRFDLPFIVTRLKHTGCSDPQIPNCLTDGSDLDIFRIISPLKKLLDLPSLRQKTIEQFLGIDREDEYDGGELINVFHAFAASGNEVMKKLLLSHNHDDVLGMSEILPILNYAWLFTGTFSDSFLHIKNTELVMDSIDGDEKPVEMILNFDIRGYFPTEKTIMSRESVLNISKSSGHLRIPVHQSLMYHFFKDYRNYYYVPSMDTAIHKSVAQFMSADDKEKAKANNCYVKKTGFFISQADAVFTPEFKKDHKDKALYFELTTEILQDPRLKDYLISQLKSMKK